MNYSNRYSNRPQQKYQKTVQFHCFQYKIIKTILRVITFGNDTSSTSRLTDVKKKQKAKKMDNPRTTIVPLRRGCPSIQDRSMDPPARLHSIYFNRDIDDLKPQ